MNIFIAFNKKKYLQKREFEIAISRLQLLSEAMEYGTDQPSDLKYWQANIEEINDYKYSWIEYYESLRFAYWTLFALYRKKHYPELVEHLII